MWQPVQISRETSADEANVAARRGLFETYQGADVGGAREVVGRQKRVIFRVDRNSRHGDGFQPGFGRGALPVIVGAGKTMDGGGDGVVELVKIDRRQHARFVEEAGELAQAVGRNGFQRFQEILRVDAVEATCQVVATGGQVERGADGGNAGDQFAGRRAAFARPLEQGVAAERCLRIINAIATVPEPPPVPATTLASFTSVAVAAAAIETPADTAAVAAASSDLGSLWLQNAQSAKAEPLLRDCLEQCFKQQPEHWLRFNIESLLGGALLQQKKYTEAGPLLQSGYEGLNARTHMLAVQDRYRLRDAIERLAQFNDATGNAVQAAQWRQKLAEFDQPRVVVSSTPKLSMSTK